jgi:hypothetical protein
MKAKELVISLTLAVMAVGGSVFAQQSGSDGNQQGENPLVFNPVKGRVGLTWKPIVDAPFVAAKDVTDQVFPEELVVGVVFGGQARAYPLNMLSGPSREIINDTVGGRTIAATW